jgi:protein SCO1/2
MIQHRFRPTSIHRAVAALAAVAFVAAACTGDTEPTTAPTPKPVETAAPVVSLAPTAGPTLAPTAAPTAAPTVAPTAVPTLEPTVLPTAEPSPAPTVEPTDEAAVTDSVSTAAVVGEPRPAPELADLIYSDTTPFDLADYEGSNVLVYFGYTHCPDVCPATLGEVYQVFNAAPDTKALFITVDPERDTAEFLEEWTIYLHDNLAAVTGSPGALRRAADNYGVKYARVETTSTAGYTMSHTAELYLIDKHGQLLLAYPFGTPAAEIAADIATLEAG